jgi:histidyl-tRNA synthetase
MNQIKAQTLKGFRDFLPDEANIRKFVLDTMTKTFRTFGFEPLETPALEYAEVLKGKYGEEEKLIYEFKTKGGDEVALRYDQTVPLARVIAQYPELPKPLKRYQIQPVWRGENPQKGRFREFLQCDIDIVGSNSPLADAEIIACTLLTAKNLGLSNTYIEVNDRSIFADLEPKYISAIDKLKKIGKEAVISELQEKGMDREKAAKLLNDLLNNEKTENIKLVFSCLKKMGFEENKDFKFVPTLARGLDYYTGIVFELFSLSYGDSSLGGGGRFDKLIGRYSGIDYPATGFAFGFDRIIEAAKELKILPDLSSAAKVLVTVFSTDLEAKSIEISADLRKNNINTELWLDSESRLDRQLKYADQKGIPFVIIIGPDEAEKNQVVLKNLKEKTQETLSLDEVTRKLSS